MKEKEIFSHYRIVSFLIILLCILANTAILSFFNHVVFDYWILGFVIDLFFFFILIFQLEYERKRLHIANYVETTFLRISVGVAICDVIAIICYFTPSYFRPVILIPLLMFSLSNAAISSTISLYYAIIMALYADMRVNELALYIFIILCTLVWARVMDKKDVKFLACFLLAIISMAMPQLFIYFDRRQISVKNIGWGAVVGLLVFILCYFVFQNLRANTLSEEMQRLDDILSDNFSAVIDLKAYSNLEFTHALLVSKICYKCAKQLKLKADLAAAAGFYYRLGKWKGEPHVETGVLYSKKLCFPPELTQILSEYYGEINPITSRESAIVHLVDALIKRLQIVVQDEMNQGWNLELIIYQHLNELSSTDIYDQSGLSINQYFKLRDYLAKEELLIEFLSRS